MALLSFQGEKEPIQKKKKQHSTYPYPSSRKIKEKIKVVLGIHFLFARPLKVQQTSEMIFFLRSSLLPVSQERGEKSKKMTIHCFGFDSLVLKKFLSTNAHLGRRVAAHHFKVSICGSRNGIAIFDSDKKLIFLRNAFHFIGSPIRQKGRSFFFLKNQKNLFLSEIMEEMASCINDSQWRIGAFLTNSCSSPKLIRSRKKQRQINDWSNQQPDCVVLMDADRKSSVILEADRSQIPIASLQIPIASLVDSTIPLGSYQRRTYPIPANAPIQFVYLFRHSITKTVILERGRIVAIQSRFSISNQNWFESIGRVVKDPDQFLD